MGRALRLAAVMCGAILFAATWRSDVAADVDAVDDSLTDVVDTVSIPEPTTEQPVHPQPVSETESKDPFAPYGIGPPEHAIPYEALSPDEQVVVDRGRNTENWAGVHRGYATAVRALSKRARAEAAAHQLGVDGLAQQGVVP